MVPEPRGTGAGHRRRRENLARMASLGQKLLGCKEQKPTEAAHEVEVYSQDADAVQALGRAKPSGLRRTRLALPGRTTSADC